MKFAVMLLSLLFFASHGRAENDPGRPSALTTESHWPGIYAGLQFGQADIELTQDGFGHRQDDVAANGLFFGKQRQENRFVTGLEVDANQLKLEGTGFQHRLLRLKSRIGLDMGRYLPYVTIGTALALPKDDALSPSQGLVLGLGSEVALADNMGLGLEYILHDFSDFAGYPDLDLKADSLQFRSVFRF